MDRNTSVDNAGDDTGKSLSARRAWIEMSAQKHGSHLLESLSARRAWIEISLATGLSTKSISRSPQGERG